jgi:replication factor C small subunit
MSNKLKDLIYTEKYRPETFDDLVFDKKEELIKYVKNPKTIPSFIFYSSKPGTGKTSCAKVLGGTLNSDLIIINSSEERGIDVVREKVNLFARSMSFDNGLKKCIFLDEADGLTKQAQDSLRNLMETYSDNVFFIFSCNDITKIIEPIRSRCVAFNFNKPDKKEILERLTSICKKELVSLSEEALTKIINVYYPDIRSMVMCIQSGEGVEVKLKTYNEALIKLKAKDVEYFRQKIFSQELDLFGFNNFLFEYFFNTHKVLGLDKTGKILLLLADTEKSIQIGATVEIVFTSNLLEIMKLL